MKTLLLVLAIAGVPLAAHSQRSHPNFTGTDLYQLCTDHDENFNTACDMWMAGFGSGVQSSQRLAHMLKLKSPTCLPEGFSGTQAKAIILKSLTDHPESMNVQADVVATLALMRSFPCASRSN